MISTNMRKTSGASIAFLSLVTLGFLLSCAPMPNNTQPEGVELTAGVVQKEITIGMTQANVAEAIGSPNIVTRDSNGKETWIYDRIASSASYQQSGGSVGLGGGAGAVRGSSLVLGLVGGAFGSNTGQVSTSQKTLTVIIKYDRNQKVEKFSFHQSRF